MIRGRGPRTRQRLAIVLACTLAGAASNSVADADPAFAVRQLAPGVFVHEGRPLALTAPGHDDIANLGFIVGTRCVAVIDSGGSVRTARALLASIRAHTATPEIGRAHV